MGPENKSSEEKRGHGVMSSGRSWRWRFRANRDAGEGALDGELHGDAGSSGVGAGGLPEGCRRQVPAPEKGVNVGTSSQEMGKNEERSRSYATSP
jgi:hypothetical protein